jgi:hypothetical protein
MDKDRSQVEIAIKFVFCTPFNEDYYSYSINTTDKTHLKSKDQMKHLLIGIDKTMSRQFIKAIDRFETFVYNVQEKRLIELDVLDDAEITDHQNDRIRRERDNDTFLTKADKMNTIYRNQVKKGYFK